MVLRMIPFKPRLGRAWLDVRMQHKRAEFRGDSSVAGRRPVASVPRRVCLPLVQVAKQGNGLIASAELDGVRGNQDLPCFRRKDSTPQETAALRADGVDYGSATKTGILRFVRA